MLDVLIRGGEVADGSGDAPRAADIGIRGDAIVRMGAIDDEDATTTVDARGLVICPGFIDVHTHSDITVLVEPRAESAVRQGVTTQVFPNCGTGLAPAVGEALKDIEERTRPFGIEVTWTTVGEYFQRVEAAHPSINIVPMVSQGTVRMAVMGMSNAAPSPSELEAMKAHVEAAMQSGARGMCSGLRYVPSGYASIDELVELASVVKKYGGVYASHIRSEGDNGDWFSAIDEALAVGRGSGVPVQISHLKALGTESWGKSAQALRVRHCQAGESSRSSLPESRSLLPDWASVFSSSPDWESSCSSLPGWVSAFSSSPGWLSAVSSCAWPRRGDGATRGWRAAAGAEDAPRGGRGRRRAGFARGAAGGSPGHHLVASRQPGDYLRIQAIGDSGLHLDRCHGTVL
jgi:N-acyl-D-aspartate/D-glutamate deacylase